MRQPIHASAVVSLDPDLELDVSTAVALLRSARKLLVITGAGISADSGMPTYRGIGGLYERQDTDDEMPIEVALSGPMFESRPELTWKYLSQIETACRGAQPNEAHRALSRMSHSFERMTVLTQNVDGFHRDAGQEELIEMHGNVHELYCTECGKEEWVQDYASLSMPPYCADCRGMVRPRVVLFQEMLPDSALRQFEQTLENGVDAVMTIGTSSGFPYISGPVVRAARMGLPTIEINPGDTEVSGVVGLRIRARAAQVLPRIEHLLAS